MDFLNNAMLVLAIVGTVKFIDLVGDKQYRSAVKILAAAIVGAVLGHFIVYLGLDAFKGALVGLSASGLITTATVFGKASAPQVIEVNEERIVD